MDTGKQIIEESKRVSKSKDVVVRWKRTVNKIFLKIFQTTKYFDIIDGENVKYHVKITNDGIYDACSCPSFKFSMKYASEQTVPFSSIYFSEHGQTFACKHIIACIDWSVGK